MPVQKSHLEEQLAEPNSQAQLGKAFFNFAIEGDAQFVETFQYAPESYQISKIGITFALPWFLT
ncbi:MAG TPA: hypothetical protein DD381_01685 [Lentisphaeria bacterium]|nr:MAG: hypothetical protein A2X47_10345 [Lentisphaerae bacterium GWF2_38_69]HBM15053.1 hypothetical protein [Lentisphaeria bacterium]